MFRVAICDNDEHDLMILKNMVLSYYLSNQISDGSIMTYTDSTELLNQITEQTFDLFILDVIMPEVNGIRLGTYIREHKLLTPIIYTTSSREYAFQAFGVHALDYLEKPVDEEALAESMNYAIELQKSNCRIIINSKDGMIPVNLNDILYIENVSRSSVYTLVDGTKITSVCNRTSFEKSVIPVSETDCFIHPHKSYFVNMNYIKTMKSDKLIMDDDVVLPISHERSTETKHIYLKFISGKGF